jgi:Na+-translocating ferredoxin:NAD+ oxidoreductase RnfG subunit
MLQKETKIGLTFGQIIAVVGLMSGVIAAYTDLNVRVAKIDEKNQAIEKRVEKQETQSETIRQENRQDHQRMEAKMDIIINKINSK